MTISSRRALGFALATLVAGCAGDSLDAAESQVVADGSQAMMATSQSTNLGSLVFESVTMTTDPVAATTQLAGAIATSGCVSYAKDATDPTVAHVTLTDCTGPFGLVHIDGEEVVTFSAGAGGALHAVITSADLSANGKPIAFSATADITFTDATDRSVVWQANWTRDDDAGETVNHTSDLEIAVDLAAGCRTASGSAKTEVATRSVDTTISDYKICRDAKTGIEGCPSGSVVHTGSPSGRVITISFDDSSVAEVTGPRGDTVAVDLVCTSIGR